MLWRLYNPLQEKTYMFTSEHASVMTMEQSNKYEKEIPERAGYRLSTVPTGAENDVLNVNDRIFQESKYSTIPFLVPWIYIFHNFQIFFIPLEMCKQGHITSGTNIQL